MSDASVGGDAQSGFSNELPLDSGMNIDGQGEEQNQNEGQGSHDDVNGLNRGAPNAQNGEGNNGAPQDEGEMRDDAAADAEVDPSQQSQKSVGGGGDGGVYVVKIRGVPWEAKEADIAGFFKGVNIKEGGIFLVQSSRGANSGEGYVELVDDDALQKARALHKQNLNNRYIEVFVSTESEMRAAKSRAAHAKERAEAAGQQGGGAGAGGNNAGGRKSTLVLRLRGIPYTAGDSELRQFFGADPDLRIVATHFTMDNRGRPSGEVYIEVADEDQAARATKFDRKFMGSRYVEVFRSTHGDLSHALAGGRGGGAGPGNRGPHGGRGRSRSRSPPRRDRRGPPPRERSRSRERGRDNGREDRYVRDRGGEYRSATRMDDWTCVRMQGLPFSATDTDIELFFREAGVVPVRIHFNVRGGDAYVEFAYPEEARRAMTQHRAYMGNRYIDLIKVPYEEVAEKVGLPMTREPPPPPRGHWDPYQAAPLHHHLAPISPYGVMQFAQMYPMAYPSPTAANPTPSPPVPAQYPPVDAHAHADTRGAGPAARPW